MSIQPTNASNLKVFNYKNAFQKHPFLYSAMFTLGTDFVIHNTSFYNYSNSKMCDFLWSVASHSALLYIVENPDSKYKVRQIASSVYHVNRLFQASLISVLDYSCSSVVDAVVNSILSMFAFEKKKEQNKNQTRFRRVPHIGILESSSIRCFKRMMLVLRRNGGVYEDVFELLSNVLRMNPKFDEILRSQVFCEVNNRPVSADEAKAIIEDELNVKFSDYFSNFPDSPTFVYSDVSFFNCTMKKNKSEFEVTIAILPPHLERMRKYDLIGLRFFSNVVRGLPFSKGYGVALHEVLDKVSSWNLKTERKAREEILKLYNIVYQGNPKKTFNQVKNANIPIYVYAPVSDFCSKHILITEVENTDEVLHSDRNLIQSLVGFTIDLYKKSHKIVSNLGYSNVRSSTNISTPKSYLPFQDMFSSKKFSNISLRKYGPLQQIKGEDIDQLGSLYASLIVDNQNTALKSASYFKIPKTVAIDSLSKKRSKGSRYEKITKELLFRRPDFAIHAAETVLALSSYINDYSFQKTQQLKSTTECIGSLLTDFSFKFVE